MKKPLLLIAITLLFILSAAAQEKLISDTSRTKLSWLGEKVTGQHTGTVNLASGWMQLKDNMIVAGEFDIDMGSIRDSESNQRLEGHLKSEDFFGVAKYPVSKLVLTGSTSFDKGMATVMGNLTIKDVTNPVEFKATLKKADDGIWFYSNITIDRTKYNVRYGSGTFFDNLGDKTIYDEFKLKVNLFVKM